MSDRASKALIEASLPGEPRIYDARLKRSGVPLTTLYYRDHRRRSREEKAEGQLYLTPSEEKALRRVAEALELDPVEVIVSAGLIPTDWGALWSDSELVRAVHAVATGGRPARRAEAVPPARPPAPRPRRGAKPAPPAFVLPSRGLSEELL